MFHALLNRLQPVAQRALRVVARVFSRWCKPLGESPLFGRIADLVRSRCCPWIRRIMRRQGRLPAADPRERSTRRIATKAKADFA